MVEEARHITFARDELTRRVPEMNLVERAALGVVLCQMPAVVVGNMVHRDIYANVGLPVKRARAEAAANPHRHEHIRWASERSVRFFESLGLVAPGRPCGVAAQPRAVRTAASPARPRARSAWVGCRRLRQAPVRREPDRRAGQGR